MKKLHVLFLAFCVLCACETNETPKLSINQMKLLIWDLTVADNLYQQQQFKDSNVQKTDLQEKYYQKIFLTHKIIRRDFLNSYAYYKQHPNMLKILLDSVENFGNRQKIKRIEVQ